MSRPRARRGWLALTPIPTPRRSRSWQSLRTKFGAAPLLAVCGCCGGAGTSTLAYLVALAAARARPEPVLVADTGGTGGGLAHYAGVAAPHSLAEIAESLAAGLAPGRPYVAARDGLRAARHRPAIRSRGAHERVSSLCLMTHAPRTHSPSSTAAR